MATGRTNAQAGGSVTLTGDALVTDVLAGKTFYNTDPNTKLTGTYVPNKYERVSGVPDGETIIANAPIIEQGGINYYPIYYLCARDIFTSQTFSKTGGFGNGGDAYVFSDEPDTLYVGTTTHTFDVSDDYDTVEEWKCRYIIAYATEANVTVSTGITINNYLDTMSFEFIASQYLIINRTSFLCGRSTSSNVNYSFQYVNLTNASFYNNECTSALCGYSQGLVEIRFPNSFTTINGSYTCGSCPNLKRIVINGLTTVSNERVFYGCYSLQELSLPNFTTITASSDVSFSNLYSLKELLMPNLTTITGNSLIFLYLYSLKYVDLSGLTTCNYFVWSTFAYTSFIKLPTDFDFDGLNFTGSITKSYEWLNNELPTKLKDNSSGTAKTITVGSSNIKLMTSATLAIISVKNWTLA